MVSRQAILGQPSGYLDLEAPERLYDLAALLRDPHRFAIVGIWSRRHGEQAAAVSTTRLRNIAGRYVGKDDPVAIVRVQKIFPATEELAPPFALLPFVAGDTRGSHHLPLMPVRANTQASSFFCLPMVCGLAFSLKEGRFSKPVDLFADPAWDAVRLTGIAERLKELEREFR